MVLLPYTYFILCENIFLLPTLIHLLIMIPIKNCKGGEGKEEGGEGKEEEEEEKEKGGGGEEEEKKNKPNTPL